MDESARNEYFIRVVKGDDPPAGEPEWPVPEEDLVIGKQDLGDGYIQYWAYPKESGKEESDIPPAEIVANEHKSDHPAILIDKGNKTDPKAEGYLELFLVKDGHAWVRNSSNLDNLEDNISAILDFSKQKFNIRVEHFMTTARVPREAEQKLDDLENGGKTTAEIENETDAPAEMASKKPNIFKNTGNAKGDNLPTSGIYASGSSSKKWVFLPVLIIIIIFGGLIFFKGQSLSNKLSKLPFLAAAPTPTPKPSPTPTPTPAPSVERSKFKVRVLNGTTTSGAAGKLLETLKDKGWNTLSAGNAADSATPQTEVNAKEGNIDAIKVMIADLAPDFEAASSAASLKSTDKADLEVIIGKK